MSAKHLERCPACGRRNRRSHQANALYWLLVHRVAEECRPQGQTYGVEAWHQYLKSRFLGCDEVTLPNRKTLQIPKSTAALDVAEFSDYFERVQAWAAERGVYLNSLEAA